MKFWNFKQRKAFWRDILRCRTNGGRTGRITPRKKRPHNR